MYTLYMQNQSLISVLYIHCDIIRWKKNVSKNKSVRYNIFHFKNLFRFLLTKYQEKLALWGQLTVKLVLKFIFLTGFPTRKCGYQNGENGGQAAAKRVLLYG